MERAARQRIRYLRTPDGVQLAWAEAGAGPRVVKAANWLTHLEYEWESPVWRHWIHFFAARFHFVRYDERGCGMTDWGVGDLSFPAWVADLEAVVEAAGAAEPFALLGISQGAAVCVAYAVRHPERVSRMVLYGGYARGAGRRGTAVSEREHKAIVELVRVGWGKENPAFRQVFTSRFVPGATPEQMDWFNELCRRTTSPENAAALLETRGGVDVADLLDAVRVPTLVVHARDDAVVPVAEGRLLASSIPGAQYVEVESANHVLLEHEPAWARFREAVTEFLGVEAPAAGEDPAFAALSPREREVLALMADGLGNADIGARLAISEKTVRNHVSNVFDKLGVWTRAQAIVFAHDRGFRTGGQP
ncbi:MAG TPA: alpha/beta fold hydrolase [Vicinamibacteria bacterium]|jgi:pimeloyl-ACP methyl ester carboxylesterase/DNA-binding CsgD family transcriptional regulator